MKKIILFLFLCLPMFLQAQNTSQLPLAPMITTSNDDIDSSAIQMYWKGRSGINHQHLYKVSPDSLLKYINRNISGGGGTDSAVFAQNFLSVTRGSGTKRTVILDTSKVHSFAYYQNQFYPLGSNPSEYLTSSTGIPLSGTTGGNPVTGDIEMTGGTYIKVPNADVNGFHSILFEESDVAIRSDDGVVNTSLTTFPYYVDIESTNPTSRGIGSSTDFTANITDLDYIQTKGLKRFSVTYIATAPTAGDDSTSGYIVGSRVIAQDTQIEYKCTDPTTGAAVWQAQSGSYSPTTSKFGDIGLADIDKAMFNINNNYATLNIQITYDATFSTGLGQIDIDLPYSAIVADTDISGVVQINNGFLPPDVLLSEIKGGTDKFSLYFLVSPTAAVSGEKMFMTITYKIN